MRGILHSAENDYLYKSMVRIYSSSRKDKNETLDNPRAMHMDPEEYPDPEVFRPERFLSAQGKRD